MLGVTGENPSVPTPSTTTSTGTPPGKVGRNRAERIKAFGPERSEQAACVAAICTGADAHAGLRGSGKRPKGQPSNARPCLAAIVPLPKSVKAVLFDFDHTLIHLGADWEALR